jgi:hypothetical protein
VYPWYTNVTKKIVDRSALSYNKAPERKVLVSGEEDEQATETYLDLLRGGRFESVMDCADSVARLLKNCIILTQAIKPEDDTEEHLMFSVLHRGNCDVDYNFKTGKIDSLMYCSSGFGPNGGRLYHYWDCSDIIDLEERDDGKGGYGCVQVGKETNPYGIIPAAVLWDTNQPRCGFWPKPAWDELIRLNEGVNLFHTEVKFNERFQAFGALFSNATMPEDQVVGPDAVVTLESNAGEAVFLEYRAPDINLEKFEEWLGGYESDIAENWGVNLRVGGNGSADSGFKLVVEEIWNLQTRNDRIKSATQYERDMYQVILSISNALQYGLPENSELMVKFPEPSLPVNAKEDWDIRKEKLAMDYMAVEDAWREENPDITSEEIEARKERIIAENVTVPSFDNVVEGN